MDPNTNNPNLPSANGQNNNDQNNNDQHNSGQNITGQASNDPNTDDQSTNDPSTGDQNFSGQDNTGQNNSVQGNVQNSNDQVVNQDVSSSVITGAKPKILLAEDEEDARLIYIDILIGAGFDAEAAENGQGTLDKLANKVYDLLLLDIIMPDMDGISVLSEIKKYPAKYGTPKVVMLTNIGGDLAIEKALNIGANGYMLKSETEPDDLVAIIKKYLSGENHVKKDSI